MTYKSSTHEFEQQKKSILSIWAKIDIKSSDFYFISWINVIVCWHKIWHFVHQLVLSIITIITTIITIKNHFAASSSLYFRVCLFSHLRWPSPWILFVQLVSVITVFVTILTGYCLLCVENNNHYLFVCWPWGEYITKQTVWPWRQYT
jgi:hypothetical protein